MNLTLPLPQFTHQLRHSLGLQHKQDIQQAARHLGAATESIQLGDDCAAIPRGDRTLLLAAEGMLPQLVAEEPWFAGWCAVMVNVSDIYAMGGVPIAIVDTLWADASEHSDALWAGMQAAAAAYQVPIVGGHTNRHSPYTALSVAILGEATHLISSFNAQPGDSLVLAIDLRGQPYKHYPCWNAATATDPERLRADLALLPHIAAQGWCDAGKDVSMGGVLGTTLMLLETSRCGAVIELDTLPHPPGFDPLRWLQLFPSYGFVLSVRPDRQGSVTALFQGRDLWCDRIGRVEPGHRLRVQYDQDDCLLWDWHAQPLTGW
jgi:AIR synthase-related protein